MAGKDCRLSIPSRLRTSVDCRITVARRALAAIATVILSVAGCASSLEQRFQNHVNYLASDKLEGRGVGSHGIELASDYIAREFTAIGLEPAGDDGTYFQTFPMTLRRTLIDESRLAFTGDKVERCQGEDFIPFNFSSDESFSGGVVFCGYGIINPDKAFDDFKDVDLTGKVALILDGEPASWADENGNPTSHSMQRSKVYNAKDRGAVAVLMVSPKPAAGEADRLTEFVAEGADAYGIPAFHITRAFVDDRLTAARVGTLDELQQKLDAGGFASAELAHAQVSGQASFKKISAPTRNVLGIRRGVGPHADEFVVIGAHYDHLGIRKPMMRKFKAGKLVAEDVPAQIHNGADDNASGTSGLIEVARMFASAPPPDRSIVFIAFTGEESGVHGSKYYIEHPVVPVDHTVAMLNMDMIGRLKPGDDHVTVFGARCGKEFMDILEPAGRAAGLTIAPAVDEGGKSDHAVFVRKQIPSMHFFSGNHPDYHQPTDDADKINAAGGAKIATLVYDVAKDLAMRDGRPEFQVVKSEKKEPPAGTPSYRVVMGLTPGFTDDGKPGMGVDAVSPEGPAEIAGMKAGDRIVRVGGKSVANVYDYMAATRNNKAGDTVEVVVLRDGQEQTLKVTLSPAR